MEIAEKLVKISENTPKVYEAGKKAEYDAFWDTYQNGGALCHGLYMFGGYNWNDDIYNPKYPLKVDAFSSMYQATIITDTKVPIDVTSGTGVNLFFNANKLKNIVKITVNATNTFSNWFYNCNELEEIRFEGEIGNSIDIHWSTELSAESYDSILDCLSENCNGQTLTLPAAAEAVYNAKYGDGSWAAKTAEHSNWEFEYS